LCFDQMTASATRYGVDAKSATNYKLNVSRDFNYKLNVSRDLRRADTRV
jgi:hypothetical protein